MGRSHYFSIYLLKDTYTVQNALRENHSLTQDVPAARLPPGSSLFVAAADKEVWWKEFFGIPDDLDQVFWGAIVFVPAGGRTFAFSFGRAYHNLRQDSFEPDFGLRVTLNAVDPEQIRNTDTIEPANARRQRTQVPVLSDLTIFDFDRDSSVLKNLAGKAKQEYAAFVRNVSGDSSLRISSKSLPEELPTLCEQLLKLYQSNDYKKAFPGIRGIARVKDPSLLDRLNSQLLQGFKNHDSALLLSVPAFVDHSNAVHIRYTGAGGRFVRDDVSIDLYYEYLRERNRSIDTITLGDLDRHRLVLTDEEGRRRDYYAIRKSLIFDTRLGDHGETYHLLEKTWYQIQHTYLDKLESDIQGAFVDSKLPQYRHENEGRYNRSVADDDPLIVCLDGKNIAPDGLTQVEPCDLYRIEGDATEIGTDRVFIHVKRSTRSSGLSHLFSQGAGAMELLLDNDESVEKLKALVDGNGDGVSRAIQQGSVRVLFAIVTTKDPTKGCRNLPLFSQINLRRTLRQFRLMRIEAGIGFIAVADDEGN